MVKLSLLGTLLILVSCQPAPPLSLREKPAFSPPSVRPPSSVSALDTTTPSQPLYPAASPRLSVKTIDGIRFEGVSFDSRSHRLRVIDQADGPGSRYQSSEDLVRRSQAQLAINAGFFTPEGKPLGLVVSAGTISGSWNSASSLGSGIYREDSSGTPSISRRRSRASVSGSRELLQAGPLLIENAMPVSGLDPAKSALRSLILTDGSSRWWIGKTSPCTLAALASALATASPAQWKVRTALNLDGGRSTDLHISGKIPGGPITRRTFFNRPVRNFIILTPRSLIISHPRDHSPSG